MAPKASLPQITRSVPVTLTGNKEKRKHSPTAQLMIPGGKRWRFSFKKVIITGSVDHHPSIAVHVTKPVPRVR
jgi:hypothetical protein